MEGYFLKKTLCLLIAILMVFTLSGCGDKQASTNESVEAEVNFAPESTAVPAENSSIQQAANAFAGGSVDPDPTAVPAAAVSSDSAQADTSGASNVPAEGDMFGSYDEATEDLEHSASVIDVSTYNFSTMTDKSLGFTFSYPSHWVNNPGVYTVCYREEVEPGDFPARVAVTRKKLTHTADADGITDELKSYLKTIYKQYDAKTFEVGSLNKSIQFMGKRGYSTTYLAFSGEIEVKGFVICCQIERTLYVFHFSASYDDFLSMESMMQYMCKSVKPAT